MTEESETELVVLQRIEELLVAVLENQKTIARQLTILVSSVQHGAQRGRY